MKGKCKNKFIKNNKNINKKKIYLKQNNLVGKLSRLNFIANLLLYHRFYIVLKQAQHRDNQQMLNLGKESYSAPITKYYKIA